MKNSIKHIFIFLFSALFVWIGSGGNYVTYHCFNCQVEAMEEQLHNCDEKSCQHSVETNTHCHGENDLNSHNPFANDQNSNHGHKNGHCVYVVEYKLDIQKNVSEIFIPSVDLFQSDLFSLFIPDKNENKSVHYYTSFIPPRCSTNTFLSTLCVFLI